MIAGSTSVIPLGTDQVLARRPGIAAVHGHPGSHRADEGVLHTGPAQRGSGLPGRVYAGRRATRNEKPIGAVRSLPGPALLSTYARPGTAARAAPDLLARRTGRSTGKSAGQFPVISKWPSWRLS